MSLIAVARGWGGKLLHRRVATRLHSVATTYTDTTKKLREISALEGISGLLGWDEMVLMPGGSSGCRGDQKEALAGVLYDKKTNQELGENLQKLKDSAELTAVQAANVRDAFKDYKRSTAIPKELAQRIAVLETTAYESWVKARSSSDFSIFAPYLQEWVDVNRQRASAMDPSGNSYDTLLDMYEKGMTSSRLDSIFTEVRAGLVPLIAQLKSQGTAPDAAWLEGQYDVDVQAKLCRQVCLDLGFDISKGRLDVSVHPFTGGSHPTDVRMTTRFKSHDLTEGLTGAVHETGHAMYEQGRNLDPEWKDLPVSLAMSMGVHESQSLLWERMVALSAPFQHYLLPKIREFFPTFPTEATPESLYLAQNTMRDPSLIRVEADELTYSLHVILRYEIERGLIDGSVAVADVPTVWNAKMLDYLGVTPPNDAQGCLQDIHWAGGAMGYFPTYTLGAMMAVQIFEHAKKKVPNLEESLSKGEFAPLRLWLNEHLHRRGSLDASADELMVAVTGSKLDPQVYLRHLREKYSIIYKL
ncbi:M32, carboxypeptidase Taq metallopeptidase peptidase [Ochromonadaceae sp. CCMP2298]|nr:M32, carboxypeptidase Taq metallopeptidase peptidase [Ochromonadaceae sp. CCMP2298]